MSINKENVKDIKYIDKIIDGTQNISYDNTTSGLSSNTIKDAIDELSSGGNYDFSVPNVYNTVPVRSETGTIAATSLIISTADGLKECGVWNDIDKTYDFNLINGSVGQLFQEAHICGKAYGNITNGQVCMFAGAYDGFGRWNNPAMTWMGMSDTATTNPSSAYTTPTLNAINWYTGGDAKLAVISNSNYAGQDYYSTSAFGYDDTGNNFFDAYPATYSNHTGTKQFTSAVWILIKLN